MKKNIFSTMGKTLMIALLGISLVSFSGCTKDPVDPTPDPSTATL